MKRFLLAALALLICLTAAAETRPTGGTSLMYRAVFRDSLLDSWQKSEYIADSGQLLSAFSEECEISITLEAEWSAARQKELISRRARITASGSDRSDDTTRFWCRYTPARDEGAEYSLIVYAFPVEEQTCLVSLTVMGGDADSHTDWFEEQFMPSVEIFTTQASGAYLALLEGCENKNGVLLLTLDFVEIDYDASFMSVIFINDIDKGYSYRLDDDAIVYLPDTASEVYRQTDAGADEALITRSILEYRGIYGSDAVYLVQFDENNRIIRLQHYNAL